MTAAKIAVTMPPALLRHVDELVRSRQFKSRSHAIQIAVAEKIGDIAKNRLALECAKLNPAEEKAWAELGLSEDSKSWAKISQVRVLSVERLGSRIGRTDADELEHIIEGLNEIVGGM